MSLAEALHGPASANLATVRDGQPFQLPLLSSYGSGQQSGVTTAGTLGRRS
jgi:hypothetical protein